MNSIKRNKLRNGNTNFMTENKHAHTHTQKDIKHFGATYRSYTSYFITCGDSKVTIEHCKNQQKSPPFRL